MPFAAGTYVVPERICLRQDGKAVDSAGRRTFLGRIVDPIPTEATAYSFNTWDPSTSAYVTAASGTTLVYAVEVWDIDLQALTTDFYPGTFSPPEAISPDEPLFGQASAVHADADNLPPELAELAAAMRNS